jgi:hypothetical protein
MIDDKSQLISQAIEIAKVNQFAQNVMNPSLSKLGPCMQQYNNISLSSWWKPIPLPEPYIEKMLALGEKYSTLKWLPLALPKVDIGDFKTFKGIWDNESINIQPTNDVDYAPEFKGLHITANCLLDFNLHDLYIDGKMSKVQMSNVGGYSQGRAVVGNWTKKLYKNKFFFNMISQIMDTFPILQISNMLILETINDVKPHREQSWAWQCPTEFRVMLHDENDVSTMYTTDIVSGDTQYVSMPDDTNSLCWSNGTQLYGIDYHNKPQYQLVVNAVWHPTKLDQLMEDSINKYRTHLNYTIG